MGGEKKLQTLERTIRIDEIVKSINKAFDKGRVGDYKKLIFMICDKYGVSERKAKEYVNIAVMRLNAKIINNEIVPC